MGVKLVQRIAWCENMFHRKVPWKLCSYSTKYAHQYKFMAAGKTSYHDTG